MNETSEKSVSLWGRIRRLYDLCKLIRFSLLLGAVVSIVFLLVPQGQEILLHLSEIEGIAANFLQKISLLLSGVLCAGSTWYCARVMFRFEFDEQASSADCFPRFKRHFPRWLGAFVLLALAAALLRASLDASEKLSLYALAALLILLAAVFLVFVYKRRQWFGGRLGLQDYAMETKGLKSYRELTSSTRVYFLVSLVLYVLALVVFTYGIGHSTIAPAIGAGAVVHLGLGLLIPLGTVLVYVGQRYNVPVLSIVMVLAVVFSPLNDNHKVRQEYGMRSSESQVAKKGPFNRTLAQYDSLESYYTAWIEKLASGYEEGQAIPVYLVAAEGGGIRAAYWTALVLSELQDNNARFAEHVLAISGVSGGSLGGAVFVGLLTDEGEGNYVERAHNVVKRDFLSPTLAVMLFPDLVQRFLPWPFFDDRAMALEESWENAWKAAEESEVFAKPFESLWSKEPLKTPLLFLNSTVVETGQRVIVSPLGATETNFSATFHEALDAAQIIGSQVPLSTAVHMSARFTYVSPAGTIHRMDAAQSSGQSPWIRVVDGGYFENSGAVTAAEIFHEIRDLGGQKHSIQLIVIHIKNEPEERLKEEVSPNQDRFVFLGEILSPLKALLQVRPARGYQARDELRHEASQPKDGDPARSHVYFGLLKTNVTLPLGWMLSVKAQDEMKRQLRSEKNAKLMEEVLAPLR